MKGSFNEINIWCLSSITTLYLHPYKLYVCDKGMALVELNISIKTLYHWFTTQDQAYDWFNSCALGHACGIYIALNPKSHSLICNHLLEQKQAINLIMPKEKYACSWKTLMGTHGPIRVLDDHTMVT